MGATFIKLVRVYIARDYDKVESATDSVEIWVSQQVHRARSRIRGEVWTVELRGAMYGELLQLFQKTLVVRVLLAVQIEALCRLNWREDEMTRAISFLHVVHEVDIRCEAFVAERWIIPINHAEG